MIKKKVIKMHFHNVLLHTSGPWTIHLIGCIFFNKFTTNTCILIVLLVAVSAGRQACLLKCYLKVLQNLKITLPHSPALSFLQIFFRSRERLLFLAPYLKNHKHFTERSSNWSLQSIWPCMNRAAAQFWQAGPGPALKYLGSCAIRAADISHTLL